jgi:hypothetical protein
MIKGLERMILTLPLASPATFTSLSLVAAGLVAGGAEVASDTTIVVPLVSSVVPSLALTQPIATMIWMDYLME